MNLSKDTMNCIRNLRKKLHNNPEASMHEIKTKKILMDFVRENTSLDVVDMGNWFYAYYKSANSAKSIAFRADYDAVLCDDGMAKHLCGHDGHSAILAGFALELEALEPEADVYLIFQPGEETGEGAKICKKLLEEENISEIYGFHNIPGWEENTVLLLSDTFACASTGMEIEVNGAASHAAYPEQGKNPAKLLANVILHMEELLNKTHNGIVLGTVIGVNIGSKSYGVSAGNGVLRLTLRAEHQEEYDALIRDISSFAKTNALNEQMKCDIRFIEEFPATVNSRDLVTKLETLCKEQGLSIAYPTEPFRWSEDFGHYLIGTKGVFFGIGCGKEHPGLHTDTYEFNDAIIETAICIYKMIVKAL